MSDASHYPISQLLLRLTELYGPSRSEFIHSIGYRNIERGLLRLDSWVDAGTGFNLILKQITKRYPDHVADLESAIEATKIRRAAEVDAEFLEACKAEHESFTPFIHAVGESTVPNGITIFGMTGGFWRWNTIQVPKTILKLPLEDQLRRVSRLTSAYRGEFKGLCPFFGRLTGFLFVRLVDHFKFDAHGNFKEHVAKPFRCCSIELQ